MRVPYPKTPDLLLIKVTSAVVDDGRWSATKTNSTATLLELLDGFLLRMGYSSAYVKGVVVQLMTKGKVHVEFRNHSERYELEDFADLISSPQAMSLLDDYLNARPGLLNLTPTRGDVTQRIVVQSPKLPKK